MKLNKLVGRSQKGSLVTFLLVLGIIGITLITGVISLELLIRWVSLGRIQHAAQEAAVTYAKSMHRLRHNQMSQHSVQAIDYTYSGLALPATSTPINGSLSSVKGASDLEYTQASQVLLSNIWGTRVSDSALIDDVRQNQCYKTQEESRFNKNAKSPRNNCDGVGKVSSPIMSLRWNFQSSAYGYGVCCPLGNNDSNKDFCVNVNVSGRMDPVMAGGLPFLHNVEFIKDGNFNINARTVVMKMAAGASGSSSEDITAEQMPSGSVKCPINSPGIPPVPVLRPAQVEALVKANCYHPEFGIIHDGIAILGNAKENCQPEKYAKPGNKVPYCPPGSPGCPLTANDPSDIGASYPGSEAPRENPVCLDTTFNEQYYLNKYPDIAAMVKRGIISSGTEHFQKFGQGEGREGSSCCSGRKCRVPVCLPGSPGCCLADEIYDPSLKKCMKCKPGETYDGVKRICIKCVPGSPGCCLADENYFMTKTGPLCCREGQSPGMVSGKCEPATTCGPGMLGYDPQTKTCTPANCPANEYMVPGTNPPTCCPTNMTIIDTSGQCKPCPNGTMPNPTNGKCEPATTCGPGMPGYDPQTKTCIPSNCPPNEYMVPGVNPAKCCPVNMTIIDTSGQCKPCPNGMMPNPTNGKCEPTTTCGSGMPNYNPQTKTCTPPTAATPSGECLYAIERGTANSSTFDASFSKIIDNMVAKGVLCSDQMSIVKDPAKGYEQISYDPNIQEYQNGIQQVEDANSASNMKELASFGINTREKFRAWNCLIDKAGGQRGAGLHLFDLNGNYIKAGISPSDKICGRVTTGSPISLILSEEVKNDYSASQFAIDNSSINKWFKWKASNQRPLLVYDPKHTNKVSSAEQLFGNYTFGKKWQNGYDALATLDKNHDNKVSGDELNDLKLWFDKNRNGISEKGEIQSLNQSKITALFFQPSYTDLESGDIHANLGYEKTVNRNKIIGKSVDWFGEGPFETEEEAILGKQYILGSGFVETYKNYLGRN